MKGTKEKAGYVEFGLQLSGMCHASIVVPVSYASFSNFKDLEALIGDGFEVRLAVDGGGAVAVTDAPRAPPVADAVKQGAQAVTVAPSESGTHAMSLMPAICLTKFLRGMILRYLVFVVLSLWLNKRYHTHA